MTTKLSKLFVATSLVFAGAAMAEQTIGIQTVAATPAIATARVQVSVVVPKIVILRVGDANATIATVAFTVAPNGAPAGPGNSLAYTGAIPPVFTTTVATTNPTGTTGVLVADAWTNATNGASLTCALSAHPTVGLTAFAIGATTAAGVPGTDTITVSGSVLGHPGANLTGCTGTPATAPIAKLSTLTGTYTYGFTGAATTAAGSYGNTVTYTATTL
jgi:hypothetical protein